MKNRKEFEELFSNPQKFAETVVGYIQATVPDPRNPQRRGYTTHPEEFVKEDVETPDGD